MRLLAWRTQGSLWFDETFSVHFSLLSWGEMFRMLSVDVHPPLYAMVLKVWMMMFGDSVAVLRLLSLFLGVVAVAVIARFAYERYGREAAIVAGSIAAFSPIAILTSLEVRMYSLLLVLVSIGGLYGFRFLEKQDKRLRDALPWMICFSLAAITHISGALVFSVFVLLVLIARDISSRLRLQIGLLSFFGVSPFLVWLLMSAKARYGMVFQEWQFRGVAVGNSHVENIVATYFGNGLVAIGAAVGMIVLLFWYIFYESRRQVDQQWKRLLVLLMAPMLVFSMFTVSVPKYFLAALPFGAVLLGGVIVEHWRLLKEKRALWSQIFLGVVVVVYVLAVTPSLTRVVAGEKRVRWDEVGELLERSVQDGDLVVLGWFSNRIPLLRYYRGDAEIYAIARTDTQFTFNEMLVRYSGSPRVTERDLRELGEQVLYRSRVHVLMGEVSVENPLYAWFVQNGWMVEQQHVFGKLTPNVVVFVR